MNATMTGNELIKLSRDEHRTVTEYPCTEAEYETLFSDLRNRRGAWTEEHSGEGRSGSEARGYTSIWSDAGWRVDLIHPPI